MLNQFPSNSKKIILFDTTLRDGELAPGVQLNAPQKVAIAQLLEQIGVDVIEVGYPGYAQKDFDEMRQVAAQVRRPIICGLASSQPEEILQVAAALQEAEHRRINVFTPVNLRTSNKSADEVLNLIQTSVTLAKEYCQDVEWSAFDAPRSDPDFLCEAVETAIASGATTITIPDSLGLCSPEAFAQLLQMVSDQVPALRTITLAVHCHDDLGFAVQNSLTALQQGARQIECSVNGLGARKGNANLAELVQALQSQPEYLLELEAALLPAVSELVAQLTNGLA